MIAFPAAAEAPPPLRPPAIVAPAPRETSYGSVRARLDPDTRQVAVFVNGVLRVRRNVTDTTFRARLALPPRNATIRLVATDADGNTASAAVGPVFGLPRAATPRATVSWEEPILARRVKRLAWAFPGISALYVQNLRTGAGAAWNARARFPAASTLKLAIAVETMRTVTGQPAIGSMLNAQLRKMLVYSDNLAANRLLVRLGGSQSAGGARVTSTMRALGLADSVMYGGYILGTSSLRPIPLRVERQPTFGVGKYTTAWDLAKLHRHLHQATGGRGPLVRLPGSFTAADARYILFFLAHSADHGKLDRYVRGPTVAVPHKAGWIIRARHDAGLVYSPEGVFVVSVMTWNSVKTGDASDVLAGRIARTALERFRELRGSSALDTVTAVFL